MRSLLVVLALALAACGGKTKSSTLGSTLPTGPAAQGPVTADALKAYFTARFPAAIKEGVLTADFGSGGVDDDVVKELGIMGVTDMRDLPALVPADFDTKGFGAIKASSNPTTTIAGLLRDLMIMHDTRLYFEKAWNNSWTSNGPQDFPAPAAYGVDFKVMEQLGVFSGGGDDEGWDEGEGDGDEDPCGGNPCGE